MDKKIKQEQVVVSMTSFPEAIPYAAKAVQSILDGNVLPDKIVLYLNLWQFPDGKIPEILTKIADENPIVEVRNYDRNIRSYCKLIPALEDFPEAAIVTVDDDVAYHKGMLRDLLKLHFQIPKAIIAHRVKRIKLERPYREWSKYHWPDFFFKRIHRSFLNLQTGVGGVLYPPHSLREDMLDADIFTKIAPSTDDIWFWAAAVANGYPIIPVPFGRNKPRGVGKPGALSLKWKNFKGGEDRNSAAMSAILEHYPELKKIFSKS